MKKFALMMILSLFSHGVWATPPSDESMQKLMTVMQFEAQVDKFSSQMLDSIETQLIDTLKQNPRSDLTPEQNERLIGVTQKMIRKSFQLFQDKSFRQEALNTWLQAGKKYYTQQEVDAMIQFYSSPVGQSIMDKQSLVTGEYMKNLTPVTQEKNQQLFEYVEKELTIEIQKILAE